jgi:hypothetical protein
VQGGFGADDREGADPHQVGCGGLEAASHEEGGTADACWPSTAVHVQWGGTRSGSCWFSGIVAHCPGLVSVLVLVTYQHAHVRVSLGCSMPTCSWVFLLVQL